jgi:hypothetical protein
MHGRAFFQRRMHGRAFSQQCTYAFHTMLRTTDRLLLLRPPPPPLPLLLLLLLLLLQETADGELVVLHDFDLLRAFPNKGPNAAAYQQLAQHGIRPPPVSVRIQVRHNATNPCLYTCFFHVRVCNLTAQLRTLRTAGRKSLYLPTNLSLPHLLLLHVLRVCPVRSCARCT